MKIPYRTRKTLFAYLTFLMIPVAVVGIVQLCKGNIAIGLILLLGAIALFFGFALACAKYAEKEENYINSIPDLAIPLAKAEQERNEKKRQEKEQRDAMKQHEKNEKRRIRSDEILDDGTICCTPDTLLSIIKCLDDYSGFGEYTHTCPICGSKLTTGHDYGYYAYVKQKENIPDTYVASSLTGESVQAWKWVQKRKKFPAYDMYCPHCEYHVFRCKVHSYTDRGEPDQRDIHAIILGKLPEENLKQLEKSNDPHTDYLMSREMCEPSNFIKEDSKITY